MKFRLCKNGNVYYVTFNDDDNATSNISTSELIARNADTIEEQMNIMY